MIPEGCACDGCGYVFSFDDIEEGRFVANDDVCLCEVCDADGKQLVKNVLEGAY